MGSRGKSTHLFLVLLFGLLPFLGGCISIGPPPDQGAGGGISPHPVNTSSGGGPIGDFTPIDASRVSLSDALAGLPAASQLEGIDITGLNLTKVWGYGVDSGGLARTWVFGMKGGGKTAILCYSGGQYTELDLPTTLPEGDLEIMDLLSPEEIFRQNMIAIVKEMNNLWVGECDLTLEEDSYQVIIRSASGSTTLTFNAEKGRPAGLLHTVTTIPAAGTPSPGSRSLLALPMFVPLGAAALAILGLRRRC